MGAIEFNGGRGIEDSLRIQAQHEAEVAAHQEQISAESQERARRWASTH